MGDSDWARRTRRRVMQLSRHRFNTLISGPAGTGKKLVAKAIHAHGPRRDAPFIPVDCQRLPAFLFRTQMFGCAHRETTTLGCLRSADGGTVYLSNLDKLDLESQQLLLRFLESGTVTPHNSEQSFDVDVRVIASSTIRLEAAVRDGAFLPQLYSRLCVLPFETSSLVDRKEDIVPIAKHLLAKVSFEQGLIADHFSDDALELIASYTWPGNVTEMLKVVEAAARTAESDAVCADDLGIQAVAGDWPTLDELRASHIRSTLERVDGNLARAAQLLGIDEAELHRQIH